MTNLISADTPFYGLFADAILSSTGAPVTSSPVTVYLTPDGTTEAGTATIYGNSTGSGGSIANPTSTDALGNLTFWASPGYYILSFSVGGVATTKTVQIDPYYADAASNVWYESTATGPLSGDVKLANASSASLSYTLPAAVQGQRYVYIKTDSSTHEVTITAPGGSSIYGQGGGVSSVVLYVQGQTAVFWCAGTDFYLQNAAPGVVPAGHATLNTSSSIPTGSWTAINTMSIDYHRGGMPSLTGSETFLVPVAGIYRWTGSIFWTSASNAGQFGVGVWHNGGATTVARSQGTATASPGVVISHTDEVLCAANDSLGLAAYQTTGSSLSPDTSDTTLTFFAVSLLSY